MYTFSGDQIASWVILLNVSARVVDRVVVRARYGNSGIDFVDEGTFAPGALIKRVLKKPLSDDLREQVYLSLDDPRDCAAVGAHFADGSAWQNSFPTPLPSATRR